MQTFKNFLFESAGSRTLEAIGEGMMRRIIREYCRENECFPRIEDLSDLMYDYLADCSYVRTENSAERLDDGMRQFGHKFDHIVLTGSDDELLEFLTKEIRLSRNLSNRLVKERPEHLY